MLRQQPERGQRTYGQRPAIARIVLESVNGEKFVSLGKVVIESQGRKIPREQSWFVPDKTSQTTIGRIERSRRICMRVISVHDIQGDGIEQPGRNAEPAPSTSGDDGI